MATQQRVLLLGATGKTGSSILQGLLGSGNYHVEALVRPASVGKPAVQKLKEQGVNIRAIDLGEFEDLVSTMSGFDILISAIGPGELTQQKKLLQAAKQAGIKRIVPCAFITIAPPHGTMLLRDEKEEIYNEIKSLGIPYTIIDVGYWYQISFPPVPSGKVDYVMVAPATTIHAEGTAPNLLIDVRDIGRFVARILSDHRTLNKYVYAYGDILNENEIFQIAEELSGEKIGRKFVSVEEMEHDLVQAKAALSEDPRNPAKRISVYISQYEYSKYVRQDNCPSYADYLGYVNARELYPDLEPTSFREFYSDVLAGKGRNVFQ